MKTSSTTRSTRLGDLLPVEAKAPGTKVSNVL